jgi:hypothetical protein
MTMGPVKARITTIDAARIAAESPHRARDGFPEEHVAIRHFRHRPTGLAYPLPTGGPN